MDLTQESLDLLLTWLHPDREEAGKKYVKIRAGLIKSFSSHGRRFPDKLADITVDRVAKRLPEIIETYTGEREPYFHRVAYYVLLESIAKDPNEEELPDDLPIVDGDEREREQAERLSHCLEQCMKGLPHQKNYLIRNYYSGEKGIKIKRRKELALSLNLGIPALRVNALRIRHDLRGCIINCLTSLER